MKMKIVLSLCLLCTISIFAEPVTQSSITIGAMVGVESDPVPGETHFAPVTKFGGAGAFVSGAYSATFPISLGDHPLFAGSFVKTQAGIELSPVHLSPALHVIFSPLPFLNFNAGATIGAGWNIGDKIAGIETYDKVTEDYTTNSAFSTMYFDAYIQGNFQFDMAVFFPGDWNHVVTLASYKLGYTGLTSGGDGTPWSHITGGSGNANGLNYSASVLLGYAMPIALEMIALQASFDGYFFEDDFKTDSYAWDPTFMNVSLNALAMVQLAENHSLGIQSGFSSRRSFDQEYADEDPLFDKTTVGREWFFNGIGLMYTYSF